MQTKARTGLRQPHGVRPKARPRPKSTPPQHAGLMFAGVSRRADPAMETARRILAMQFALMQHNARLASHPPSIKAVHDLRVAVRRFRTALRIFDDLLQGTSAEKIQTKLQTLNRRLGPVRDCQVWLDRLQKTARRQKAQLPADWDRWVHETAKACAAQERTLARVLKSARFKGLQKDGARLLRVELPREQLRQSRHDPSRPFLAGKLLRAYGRLVQAGDSPSLKTADAAHALRRRCRRARYLAEFVEPMLDQHVPKLTRRLKRVADALGDWHDAEVHAAKLKELPAPPSGLRRLVVAQRKKSQQQFVTAWRRLIAPRFQKRVLTELRAAERES